MEASRGVVGRNNSCSILVVGCNTWEQRPKTNHTVDRVDGSYQDTESSLDSTYLAHSNQSNRIENIECIRRGKKDVLASRIVPVTTSRLFHPY